MLENPYAAKGAGAHKTRESNPTSITQCGVMMAYTDGQHSVGGIDRGMAGSEFP